MMSPEQIAKWAAVDEERRKRNEDIIARVARGERFYDVAMIHGLVEGSVRHIVCKSLPPVENELLTREEKLMRNRIRARTRAMVASGAIVKSKCERCDSIDTVAHHDEYNEEEPAAGLRWLCRFHHGQIHRELGWGHGFRGEGVLPKRKKRRYRKPKAAP